MHNVQDARLTFISWYPVRTLKFECFNNVKITPSHSLLSDWDGHTIGIGSMAPPSSMSQATRNLLGWSDFWQTFLMTHMGCKNYYLGGSWLCVFTNQSAHLIFAESLTPEFSAVWPKAQNLKSLNVQLFVAWIFTNKRDWFCSRCDQIIPSTSTLQLGQHVMNFILHRHCKLSM